MIFSAEGNVRCLYFEEIDLHRLGTLRCERASQVEFNAGTQKWEVRLPESSAVMFSSRRRQRCLDWERQHFSFAV
jgi:hypothetical protein